MQLVYVRTDEVGNPTALVCPVTTLERGETGRSVQVDLIAAVHFADASYYREINSLFTEYEVVLVELVTPKGTTLEQIASRKVLHRGGGSVGILETLQKGMGHLLGLVNQLDGVDYGAGNLVKADMDAETLFQRISENRELSRYSSEMVKGFFKGEEDDPADGVKEPELSLTTFLLSRNKRLLMKRVFAVELARSLAEEAAPFQKTLIEERNAVLLEELNRQIAQKRRKLAVFFGAAHVPGIYAGLIESGFHETESREITAWDLTDSTLVP